MADVSRLTAYGALTSSAPRFEPSRTNCTPTVPALAVAVTAITPETVAFAPGEVIDAVGPAAAAVVNVRSPETPRLPAASRDRTL